MLKILHARLQQYVNQELPDVQAWFKKEKNQIGNIGWMIEKVKEYQNNHVSLSVLKPLTL